MTNISGTYTIVVKKNEIVSVEKDGKKMTKRDVNVPHPNFENDPPTEHKLKHGCVGLGLSYEGEGRAACRWLWGKWF